MSKIEECIELLKTNKNLILTGAPGTGKTFLARQIAETMGAEYEFVQFHPSYDYTDFVEGLRPTPPNSNGNIGFERKDGVFKEFCKKAISKSSNISTNHLNDKVPPTSLTSAPLTIYKHEDTFDEAYKILVEDIKKNQADLYSDYRHNPTSLRVRVRPGEKIQGKEVIEFWKTKDFQKAQIDYIRKIYSFYISKGQFDIKRERFDDFTNIIGNTIDYSYYRGIVQGLLDRTKQTKDYTTSINNSQTVHFNHPDILPSTQNIQPQPEISTLHTTPQKEKLSPFIFIIDEINRGEISKIFGELFFCIDPSYRGKKGRVKTQYQNLITDKGDSFYEGFYVPENVYIIGTMNDIDRSVESMDFAMRRRFAWKEIKATENIEMLDSFGSLKDGIVERMNRLNNAIWNDDTHEGIEGLSAAYHIGGAYFKKLELYLDQSNSNDAYRKLWENHLRGVLFDYLRGSLNATDNLQRLEDIYFSKHEYK